MLTIKEKLAPTWTQIRGAEFLIGPLSQYDAIDFRAEFRFSKGTIKVTGEGMRIAGNAVRDWRHVTDEKGAEIPFSRDAYDKLPIAVLTDITSAVFERTFLSEIERKNSSSPST